MSDWHIPAELIDRFAADPNDVDSVTAASIEHHLMACPRCQAVFAGHSSRSDLDAIWTEVADRMDRAGIGFSERLLRRLGIESGPARLIAATPALRLGVVAAVGFMVAAVVLMSRVSDTSGVYLVLAPIVPTGLVALSFAPGADPAGECGLATPVFGFGLVMRRALGVELVALIVLTVGSAFVPIDGPRALAWLIPALALSMGTLAGAARWSAADAAAALMAVWIAVVVLAYTVNAGGGLAESVVFDPAGQLVFSVMATISGVVIVMNRHVLLQEVRR